MLPIDKLPPEARLTLQVTLLLSGSILMIVSAYFLVDPAVVYAITGIDEHTTKIIAVAFLIFGAMDTAISLIIFRRKDRK